MESFEAVPERGRVRRRIIGEHKVNREMRFQRWQARRWRAIQLTEHSAVAERRELDGALSPLAACSVPQEPHRFLEPPGKTQ
jgi:hypothetical protein